MSSCNPQNSTSAGYSTTDSQHRLGALRSWRWRGSLQDLPHLPVEIQLKVYSHLHPRDLLALTRTCKKFRTFFLHRSNEPLWRAARENAGNLPQCPPFISEPAFSNLLFSRYCQICGWTPVWQAMWPWFLRYCRKCAIAVSYSYNETRDKILNVDRHNAFSTYGALFHLFGVHRNTKKTRFVIYPLQNGTSSMFRFHKTHIDAFIQDLDQLPKPITHEVRLQFIARQKACVADKLPYVNACIDWHSELQSERAARFEARRHEYVTEIFKHLNEKGWDKEVELLQRVSRDLSQMEELRVMRQPSKLTPKSWEKVFQAIYPILWPYRHGILVKERAAVFRPRFAALQAAILAHYIQLPRTAQMDYHPNSVDLALMDECRAIADVPEDKTVTQEDFAALVPELAARWEQERKTELTEAVIAYLPVSPPNDVDVLSLGIAIFPCSECRIKTTDYVFYRYPTVLGHPCDRGDHKFKQTHNKDLEVYPTLATIHPTEEAEGSLRYPFSLSRLCSQRDLQIAMFYMLRIMSTMGLDPSRTTAEELQACPARLRCTWCTARSPGWSTGMHEVYSWEAALKHSVSNRHIRDRIPEQAQWALANTCAADSEPVLSLMTDGAVWACSLCVQWDDGGDKIQVHLMEKHGIEYSDDCIKDGTIYLHQAKSTVCMRPPVSVCVEADVQK